MASGTFGTAINCMDGRVQTPVADWVKTHHAVNWVDMITEAGADGVLAHGADQAIESIRRRVLVSVQAHGSRVVAIAGHEGCAGNAVSREQHYADIQRAMGVVAGWGLPIQIVGLFVSEWGVVEVVPPT